MDDRPPGVSSRMLRSVSIFAAFELVVIAVIVLWIVGVI